MTMEQTEYQLQHDAYEASFRATHLKIEQINEQREALIAKHGQIRNHLETLKNQETIKEFDEPLFYGTVG